MKKILLICSIILTTTAFCQQHAVYIPTDTAQLNLNQFAHNAIGNATDNYKKAQSLLNWLSTNFEWKYTDYQKRTVKEIIVRKGGNCFELASVYIALLKELNLKYRPIAEINLHVLNEQRGITAAEKVKQVGNKMSVFGRQHNDHRWVEIYDDKNKEWLPADPTMDIIGYDQWLKARAWFGKRHTINDEFSNDMIAPFAIFVVNSDNKSKMEENRTLYYMKDKLDALYDHQLSKLPSWNKWVVGLQSLSDAASKAFGGEVNLHQYNNAISELAKTYQDLKEEYNHAIIK